MKTTKNPLLWLLKNWEEVVTIIAVSLMFSVCCAAVIARYAFDYGIAWSTEICDVCLIYTTFVGGAAAYKRNQHFGMDFLTDRLKPKSRYAIKLFLYAVQILLFGYLLYLSVQYTASSRKVMDVSRIPYRDVDFAAVLGFGSMCIYSVIYFIMGLRDHDTFYKRFVRSQALALQEEEQERGEQA